jgi:16S rRNA (uracil1498-N3)-methyltransferase
MDRTEFAIEKLVELGVDQIVLLKCQHSERTHIRIDRLQKVMLSAAKQSHKMVLPDLLGFMEPGILIQKFEILTQQKVKSPSGDLGTKSKISRESVMAPRRSRNPQSAILCCHPDESSKPLHHTYQPADDVIVMIGPEGGFSDSEIEEMKTAGAEMNTLWPFRLRVETAAIAACAQIHLLNEMHTRK